MYQKNRISEEKYDREYDDLEKRLQDLQEHLEPFVERDLSAYEELLKSDCEGHSRLKIFRSCTEIIRCLPMLQIDAQRPTDTSNEPHEITHAPDALRGFAIFYSRPNEPEKSLTRTLWSSDMWQDYYAASEEEKIYLKKKYGEPL